MWQLVKIFADQTHADRLSEALLELGALSVGIEDAQAGTAAEQAIFGEPGMAQETWHESLVSALFDPTVDIAPVLRQASQAAGLAAVPAHQIEALAEQDWVRLTQSQFTPVPVTPSFWVVPSWHEAPPEALKVIRLDPGMAFGTGTHPTTRMCLRWIAQQAPERTAHWSRVLDYGCGSGILAIGAALHGACGVEAVDIDAAAVRATLDNAAANRVDLQAGLPDMSRGAYALVLANILATPLKLLAPLLCSHVQADGDMVLAGILERQAAELIEAYAPWLDLSVSDREDGWILMTAHRPA